MAAAAWGGTGPGATTIVDPRAGPGAPAHACAVTRHGTILRAIAVQPGTSATACGAFFAIAHADASGTNPDADRALITITGGSPQSPGLQRAGAAADRWIP